MIGDPEQGHGFGFCDRPKNCRNNTRALSLICRTHPTTNMVIQGNTVQGAPGHALLLDADSFSDMTGVIKANDFSGSGRDGIRFNMIDSNFTGAVLDNVIQNNGENGIGILPTTSRSGIVERVQDLSQLLSRPPIMGWSQGIRLFSRVLSTTTLLSTIRPMAFTITLRIDNNRFRLNLVNGTAPGVSYAGGGAWYVPDFQPDGTARGLVTIDMQNTVPQGTVRAATNAGPIVITSPDHGLTSGQRVRISNVNGNTAANGVFKITVVEC